MGIVGAFSSTEGPAMIPANPSKSAASRSSETPEATTKTPGTDRLIRLPAVLQTVQGGRTWWLDLVKAGKAPASVKIGRATFWRASELQAWIADRVRESRGAR